MYLLDKDSIFELLVRTHYPDLQNILEAYPELFNMTETTYFKTRWKEYNIRTIEQRNIHIVGKDIIEIDRLGRRHGMTRSVDSKGELYEINQYVNNVRHRLEMRYYNNDKVQWTIYWYNGLKQGTATHYRPDGSVYETTYNSSTPWKYVYKRCNECFGKHWTDHGTHAPNK
jgi:antitoxin component YwqK of YwqJK toxin-antitoxin module